MPKKDCNLSVDLLFLPKKKGCESLPALDKTNEQVYAIYIEHSFEGCREIFMGQEAEFRTLIFAINRIETVRAIFRLLEERHASGSQPKPAKEN